MWNGLESSVTLWLFNSPKLSTLAFFSRLAELQSGSGSDGNYPSAQLMHNKLWLVPVHEYVWHWTVIKLIGFWWHALSLSCSSLSLCIVIAWLGQQFQKLCCSVCVSPLIVPGDHSLHANGKGLPLATLHGCGAFWVTMSLLILGWVKKLECGPGIHSLGDKNYFGLISFL